MQKSLVLIGVLFVMFTADQTSPAQSKPRIVERGRYAIHLLLRPIGTEEYTVSQVGPNQTVMTTTSTSSDRGKKRTTTSTLEMGALSAPITLEQTSTDTNDGGSLTRV